MRLRRQARNCVEHSPAPSIDCRTSAYEARVRDCGLRWRTPDDHFANRARRSARWRPGCWPRASSSVTRRHAPYDWSRSSSFATPADARGTRRRGDTLDRTETWRSGIVGYNVQVAVDTKHHLIVACEVTDDGGDRAQPAPMANAAREAIDKRRVVAIADRGYYSAPRIKDCQDAGKAHPAR